MEPIGPPTPLTALFALGQLEQLSLRRLQSPAIELTGIGALTALRALDLDRPSTPVEDIAPLRDLPQLRALHLGGSPLAGQGALLGELSQLEVLSLDDCALGDADAAALGRLHRLRSLALASNPLGDAAVAAIAANCGLRDLDLSGTGVTDACCSALGTLEQLRALDLLGTQLTGARLRELGSLRELRVLAVTGIAASGVAQLAVLSQLTTLVLDRTALDPAAARALAALPMLDRLELIATDLGDDAAPPRAPDRAFCDRRRRGSDHRRHARAGAARSARHRGDVQPRGQAPHYARPPRTRSLQNADSRAGSPDPPVYAQPTASAAADHLNVSPGGGSISARCSAAQPTAPWIRILSRNGSLLPVRQSADVCRVTRVRNHPRSGRFQLRVEHRWEAPCREQLR